MPKSVYSHWATSEDFANLSVSLHDAGTGLPGRSLGICQRGGDFVFDPFIAYANGLVTNPNMVLAGAIGVGKSTLVKMLLLRGIGEGRRGVIIDPKGEYGPLAEALGVRPITFGTDGWCNPFVGDEVENLSLLRTMLSSLQSKELSSEQLFILTNLWRENIRAGETRVFRVLLTALESLLFETTPTPGRDLALLLYRFVHGDLSGYFDGPGDPVSLNAGVNIIDLSHQWSGEHLSLVALTAIAAAQHTLVDSSIPGYLVIDEAWALLSDHEAVRWLQGSWKLARSRGISHILVLHRWSDISAAGDHGSVQRERASGLLRECETSWLFRQGVEEASEMALALGLNQNEAKLLTALPKGTALVRYASYRSVVAIEPDDADRQVSDTDEAMR